MQIDLSRWPKPIPQLSLEQQKAREEFMQAWHEHLPQKYGFIEKFNHGWVAGLPLPCHPCKTLEIGAGLGEHIDWEDLEHQDYTMVELRKEFCEQIQQKNKGQVLCADVQQGLQIPDHSFDRIIAIHVLEHLPNLPVALKEVFRLLKPYGVFDIVIPCEGGLAYHYARKFSSQRFFESRFKMSYEPIIRAEHVNTAAEVLGLLKEFFHVQKVSYYPFLLPSVQLNLALGLRVVPLLYRNFPDAQISLK